MHFTIYWLMLYLMLKGVHKNHLNPLGSSTARYTLKDHYLIQGKCFCQCKSPASLESTSHHSWGCRRGCTCQAIRIRELKATDFNTKVYLINRCEETGQYWIIRDTDIMNGLQIKHREIKVVNNRVYCTAVTKQW